MFSRNGPGLRSIVLAQTTAVDFGFTFICPFLVNDVLVVLSRVAKSGHQVSEQHQRKGSSIARSTCPAGACSPKERAEQVRASVVSQFIETSTSVGEQDQGLGCASGGGIKHCYALQIRTPKTKCDCCLYEYECTSSVTPVSPLRAFLVPHRPIRCIPGILVHVPAAGAVSISDRSHVLARKRGARKRRPRFATRQ